jgi:hypothetical protein
MDPAVWRRGNLGSMRGQRLREARAAGFRVVKEGAERHQLPTASSAKPSLPRRSWSNPGSIERARGLDCSRRLASRTAQTCPRPICWRVRLAPTALRGMARAVGLGLRTRPYPGSARTLPRLHDGLLSQCKHADAHRHCRIRRPRRAPSGDIRGALGSLFHRSVARSLWSLVGELPQLRRLQRARAA